MRVSLSLCTFLHLLLFNFQGPSLACRLFMRLIYYITFPCVCQGVLQKFFKFFLKLFCFAVPWLRLATTFILYHIFKRLSRGLRKFFESFFKAAWLAAVLDATCILYHTFSRLSRGFAKVFRKFFADLAACFREALSLTAYILYHNSFDLSRGFSKIIQIFSHFSFHC